MEDLEKTIRAISVPSTEDWIAGVEWRRTNKFWIRKSADIALRILDALDDLGWNKARLAKEIGVSPQQVSKYVRGEENFKLETLCKLEQVLGVELIRVMQSDEEVIQKGQFSMVNEPSPSTYQKERESE